MLAFVMGSFTISANNFNSSEEFADCDEYANNAANEEVSWVTTLFDGGQALMASYNYWLGVCESHNHGESELLSPIFL